MARELTWDEYVNLMRSGIVRPIVRLDMCRQNGSVYDSFTKYPLNGSTLTIDSSNGCRRSVNLTLDNSDGFFLPDPINGKMWVNLMFKLYVGIEDSNGNYKLFPQGIYTCANSQPTYNSTPSGERTVNIVANDKWSLLSSNSLGNIYQIPISTLETDAIRDILPLCGDEFSPIMEALQDSCPFTMRWDATSNYGNILKDLANVFSRDIYYDVCGHLVFKTYIDIQTLETEWEYTTNEVTYLGGTRQMQFDNIYNRIIVLSSNSTNNKLYKGIAENTDASSFTRLGYIPTKTLTITNDKLWSNSLCQQNAEYELEKRKRIQESITLKSIVLPHMDTNKSISITDSALGLNRSRYAVQKIQMPLDMQSEMSLTCLKYNDGSDFEDRITISASDGVIS